MMDERILVVDDSAEIRRFIIQYVLRPNGFVPLEAPNGAEALRLIQHQPPDLMITDLQMPQMNGLELLYRLRDSNIELPTILITFHGSEEIAIEVFRLGVKDYLVKPFNADDMLGAIERALSVARLRQERDRLVEELVLANRLKERQIEEIESLFAVGRVLTGQPDAQSLIAYLLDDAYQLFKARRATLLLVDEGGTTLAQIAEKAGTQPVRFDRRTVSDTLAWDAIRNDQPCTGQPLTDPVVRRSLVQMAAPLIIGQRRMGALCMFVPPGEVTAHRLNLLNTLADYAAIGLEQARLLA